MIHTGGPITVPITEEGYPMTEAVNDVDTIYRRIMELRGEKRTEPAPEVESAKPLRCCCPALSDDLRITVDSCPIHGATQARAIAGIG